MIGILLACLGYGTKHANTRVVWMLSIPDGRLQELLTVEAGIQTNWQTPRYGV